MSTASLRTSSVPAADIAAQAAEARDLTFRIAGMLGHVGVLAGEFFATADGPVFNEMRRASTTRATGRSRVAVTSQFENHVRAICGLPLGSTALAARRVEMTNLIGDDVDGWRAILADPAAHLHLYGKAEARLGRKMGHVTQLTL